MVLKVGSKIPIKGYYIIIWNAIRNYCEIAPVAWIIQPTVPPGHKYLLVPIDSEWKAVE